ncbi:hypothetical protein FQN51_004780 [Onygenales sp. PD_10]|nr:hypothetical protein FQN51_004780 [Onygenales sp. PD_10]
MATATLPNVSTNDTGVLGLMQTADAAQKVSELLKADMERHHVFFNDRGFHNHIPHHLLTIYALGGTPEEVQKAYGSDVHMQQPSRLVDETKVAQLSDKENFKALIGNGNNYPHFLAFFQRQIDAKGIGAVLNEYVFAGDDVADDMFVRLYGAIVAEALAQTAVHEALYRPFLVPAEQAAGGIGKEGKKSLVQLQKEIRSNDKLRSSIRWDDDNKIFDGVMARAPEEMIKIASQFSVGPDQMEEKLAELLNAIVYFAGTSQRPDKRIKFDFFLLHCVTSAIFLRAFISQPWLSTQNKLRILEWKGRMDLLQCAARGCLEPRPEDITHYKPGLSWDKIFSKAINHPGDDGHVVKLIRSLAYGEKLCKPFEEEEKYKEAFPIRGDMWVKLANMGECYPGFKQKVPDSSFGSRGLLSSWLNHPCLSYMNEGITLLLLLDVSPSLKYLPA